MELESKLPRQPSKKKVQLTAATLSRGLPVGKYYDGKNNGLGFQSYGNGRGCWGIRVMVDGERHYHGGRGYPRVSLKKARKLADKIKKRLLKGKPAFPKKEPVRVVPTLEEASSHACAIHRGPLETDPGARMWKSSIERHVPKRLRAKPVSAIDSSDIVAILTPLWDSKRPTATHLRTCLHRTMACAIADGYRKDNPAGEVLRGALKIGGHTVTHRRAHKYPLVAAAVAKFRETNCAPETHLLYEALALTALRTSELRGLRWDEIDWHSSFFCIPPERMKVRHEFVVPMSSRVASLFQCARDSFRPSDYVFPGKSPLKPLSKVSLPHALKRHNVGSVAHGLRSSFRTWAAEVPVRDAVAESCLAHGPKNMYGRTYIRTDFFDERREVMELWAQYLLKTDPICAHRTRADVGSPNG